MTTPSDLYYSYLRGWTCGARGTVLDQRFIEHDDNAIRKAYRDGWHKGVHDKGEAATFAQGMFGYQPTILRGES